MRILIIEDQEKLAESLKTALESDGYAVDFVIDGQEGQKRLELYHKDYDLAIIDLMLPTRDGFEITRDVRSRNIRVPILILTGREAIDDKVAALDAGADDYLLKPFSLEELKARVRALLRRPNEVLPTILQAGDLVLDPATRQVKIRDKEVSLTLKEFMLLEFFMRNPDRALSREQIYDNLWDFASSSFSNVIDVYIKNLRRKLKPHGYDMFIETVRGVGYRLKK